MPSLITITPETERLNGEAILTQYEFSGNYGRKFFTIENVSGSPLAVNIFLNMGGTGGFKLFPLTYGATAVNMYLSSGDQGSFAVDYDSSWGPATTASITSDVDIYTESEIYPIIGPTTSFNFTVNLPQVQTKREIGSLLSLNEDGDYHVEESSRKITEDETSFGLVRTNPKLTGNVKITVDSNQEIWLNSIDAVKDLSDDRFKKFRIGRNSSFAADLNKFFDYGSTPPEIVFSLYEVDNQYTSTKRSLDEQYDRFYQYGVSSLNSRFYSEDFSFFAPLYLKKEVPDYFVIFRTDGAINKFSYDMPFDEWPAEVSQILSSSTIVKVFDLGENSSIGAYLRNIVNHPSRKESDLTVSYQENGYTTYNGIFYPKGSFTQAGELLYEYFNQENPLISVEEFITLGFERNKVISSHVVNLEFLFDDVLAENYSINRYFGLYVNAIDLAKFNISEGGLQYFSSQIGQTPLPRKGVDGNKLSQKSFVQSNSQGISIFVEKESIKRAYDLKKPLTSEISEFTLDSLSGISTIKLPGNLTYRLFDGDSLVIKTVTGLTATATVSQITYAENETTVILDDFTSTLSASYFDGITSKLTCDFYSEEKMINFSSYIMNNEFIEDQPRLFYINDRNNSLHSVKSTEEKFYHIDPFTVQNVLEVKLKDVKLDMALMSGFNNILTQTEGVSLNGKGRSSLSLQVERFFNPNDYLEVVWLPGPSAEGYPLRWKIVANATALSAGDTWPDYAVDSDSEGEYYLSYFHPGDGSITMENFVSSLQNAFNRFPFKNFEVLAKGTSLHFRSTQEGLFSESTILRYSVNDSSTLKVMGISVDRIGEISFIGGSNRNHTRAKISKSVAEGMLFTEYVSTKGNFSKLKNFNIQNEKIIFAPYLEEPVYDEEGEILIDFAGCDDYRIICLEDESQPIQLTSDGKITTYQLFEPAFGILSVLPLRDFDTDFFFSDYTKSYLPELIEYFGRYAPPAKIVGASGSTYTFDSAYKFESYPASLPFLKLSNDGISSPILYNSDNQFVFYSSGATATLISSSAGATFSIGDTVLFMPDKKHTYFSDLELAKFKGFLSLSGVISSQDEERFKSLENLWDPTRFTFQLLASEYDRLAENYLKSLVLKSRVVPYVSKWVSPQGKDIRDNPYRFNYHRSFGNMNFSPSSEMPIPDPRYHTHEWPYLDSVPENYPIEKFPDYAFSYMFDEISSLYDFSSLKRDWFSEYFSTGYPTEKYLDTNGNFVSAKLDPAERYSYFNYQDYNDTTETLFRGYKFAIKEIDTNGAPVNLSTKYNNYKFSAIIETKEDSALVTEDPIEFKTIVNEKWKFILLKITVKVSSYRFPTGKVKYTDLYTLYNNDEIGIFYNNDGGFFYKDAVPTDKKISTPLNFRNYAYDPTLSNNTLYFSIFPNNNSNYIDDLREEIVPLSSGVFSRIIATQTLGSTEILFTTSSPYEIYSRTILKLSTTDLYMYYGGFYHIYLPYNSVAWKDFSFYHEGGGNYSLSGIRERLTFSEILKVMQGTSDKAVMQYQIYKEDGTSINTANFAISPISPESLTRIYDYFPVQDTDKPQEFYSFTNIGSVLEQQKDLQVLYRYQGNFSPKFRDVLKFWLREDEKFTNLASLDFLLNNTHLGEELKDFSVLKNQYYSKVSDNEVLRLSSSSGYQPVYPLIGEIAIDKKDVFAWSSSWDKNYYRKYSSSTDFEEIKGTEEMKETKSFLGSKAMKVPKQYDLYQFKLTESNNLNLQPLIDNEFVYFEDASYGYLQVNVYQRLLREMMGTSTDNRAKTEFLKTLQLVPESFNSDFLDDYVSLYLKKNILDLYEISEVKLYILETGNPGENSIATVSSSTERPFIEFTLDGGERISLSESILSSKGYSLKKDAKVTTLSNLSFSIKYPLDSRYYTSLSIGVVVKRI